jgi:hypothetical protein
MPLSPVKREKGRRNATPAEDYQRKSYSHRKRRYCSGNNRWRRRKSAGPRSSNRYTRFID